MTISVTLKNSFQKHDITLNTEAVEKSITIPPKEGGFGSSVNGGELLFLALGTCFCNDLYREAARRNMTLDNVEVIVSGEFGKEGESATKISYAATVKANNHSSEEIAELVQYVDNIAEIHNTLRKGIDVKLKQ